MVASIFSPSSGRIGIWRGDNDQATANTSVEAVRRALELRRSRVAPKRTRKTTPTHAILPVSTPQENAGRLLEEGVV